MHGGLLSHYIVVVVVVVVVDVNVVVNFVLAID